MTHPTIEAAQNAINEAYEPGAHNSKAEAKAAARVILSAPPSEAEVEAAAIHMRLVSLTREESDERPWVSIPEYTRMHWRYAARAAIIAARAKCLEELGVE